MPHFKSDTIRVSRPQIDFQSVGLTMFMNTIALTIFALSGCTPDKPAPCAEDAYAFVSEESPSEIDCVSLTVCGEAEYETQPPSYSSDRQCAPLTTCVPGEAILEEPTPTSDRRCVPCELGTGFSSTENALECTSVGTCLSHEYIATAATVTSDLECGDCQTDIPVENGECLSCIDAEACITVACRSGFIPANGICVEAAPPEHTDCTLESDGMACACTDGHFGTLEWNQDTMAWEGQCVPWSMCVPGTYAVEDGTDITDRLCEPCTEGVDYSSDINASTCTPVTDCLPGEAVSEAPTASRDRTCMACVAGLDFSTTLNAPSCLPVSDCQPGEFVIAEASTTADRTCDACSAGIDFSVGVNAANCSSVTDCQP
ncbi:MAG: hypothetical protein VX026_09180, partial [Myxococcota bacterium]|nr:hypothetical protein [Myxococcota bacterium]